MRDRWLWIGLVLLAGLMAIGLATGNDRLFGSTLGGIFLGLVTGVGAWLIRAINRRSEVEKETPKNLAPDVPEGEDRLENIRARLSRPSDDRSPR